MHSGCRAGRQATVVARHERGAVDGPLPERRRFGALARTYKQLYRICAPKATLYSTETTADDLLSTYLASQEQYMDGRRDEHRTVVYIHGI